MIPLTANRRRSTPPPRGFTLVELAVASSVMAVLVVVVFVSLQGMRSRNEFATRVGGLTSDFHAVRQRALSEQAQVVVAFLLSSDRGSTLPDRYFVLLDPEGTFDLASFDPGAVAPPQELLAERSLDKATRFGPEEGFGRELPAPFAGVPASTACSFCGGGFTEPWDVRGAVYFLPNGSARFSGGARFASISLEDQNNRRHRATLALVGPTAAIRSFEP